MKKVLAAFILCLVLVSTASAGSLVYVYGNSLSSDDFEEAPKRGQVFVDRFSNVVIAKEIRSDVVVFDKLISRSDYVAGSSLSERGRLHSLNLMGSLDYALLGYSATTGLYPLSFLVLAGAGYGSGLGASALLMAGLNVTVPLARLWDLGNTFIENGKLIGWGAVGISISGSPAFASGYGVSYRHSLGSFNWEAGASWIGLGSADGRLSPYLGLGCCL